LGGFPAPGATTGGTPATHWLDLGELALSGGFLRSPKGLPKASDLFKRESTEEEEGESFRNYLGLLYNFDFCFIVYEWI
jgi:hypothetical protein